MYFMKVSARVNPGLAAPSPPGGMPGKHQAALGIPHAIVDFPQGFDLRGGEAVGRIASRAFGEILGGIEPQRIGFSTNPSVTPSRASHLSRNALLSRALLAGVIMPSPVPAC